MEGNRCTAAGDANLLRANRRASKDTGSSGILSKRAVIQPSAFPHAVPGETDPPPCALGAELADGSARRLDPRHVPCARAGGAIFAGFLCLGGGGAFAFLLLGTETSGLHLAWIGTLAVVVLALVALAAWFYPPLELRHATWRLSPFGLEIRRGVWFRHAVSVPRARVQHTDVARGPLERRFDLATLVVHTAGHQDSEIRLEGLEHATALAIRDYLLEKKREDECPVLPADGA